MNSIKQSFTILFTTGLFLFGIVTTVNSRAAGPEREYSVSDPEADIVEIAKQYLGTPYRFGGESPSGFDCSGLTSYVYGKAGIQIPRQTTAQYVALDPIRTPRPGDLLFFRIDGKKVSHVGIYTGNFQFIHAPSTGKTVSYADIRTSYWKERYAGSRTPSNR